MIDQRERQSLVDRRPRWLRVLSTAFEVSGGALLTWFVFLAVQAVALHFMVEGF